MVGQPLTTNNPRLLSLLDSFYKQSPCSFVENHLIPYVSKENAEYCFLGHKSMFDFTKGDFSYGNNDKALVQDIQYWIGICRLLGYAIKCIDEKRYGEDLKIELKYSVSNQIKRIWHLDYNEHFGSVVFTVNASLWSDNASLKYNLGKASILLQLKL